MLALALASQPVAGAAFYPAISVEAAASSGIVNLENSASVLWVGGDDGWGNSACTMKEEGSKVVFDVSNFGGENSEWQLQYHIDDLELKDNTTYTVEFDIKSDVAKDIFVKLDDKAGFIAEKFSLVPGDNHFSKTVECTNFDKEKPFLSEKIPVFPETCLSIRWLLNLVQWG